MPANHNFPLDLTLTAARAAATLPPALPPIVAPSTHSPTPSHDHVLTLAPTHTLDFKPLCLPTYLVPASCSTLPLP